MVNEAAIGPAVAEWARRQASVRALMQIGSRVRAQPDEALAADRYSDWDFQVVASRPEIFATRAWVAGLGLGEPLAYVARLGRLGSATKVSLALAAGEIDFVVLPAKRLRVAKLLVRTGLAARFAGMRAALGGLALVLRDGHRMVKGEAEWGGFFRAVVAGFPAPRPADGELRMLAEGFVCDFISTRKKIDRGEFLAAQRWLHHQLAEVNFQLLHALRQRRGETSLPDARRIERLACDWKTVEVSATPTAESLRAALEKSAATLRVLMGELIPGWRWPL